MNNKAKINNMPLGEIIYKFGLKIQLQDMNAIIKDEELEKEFEKKRLDGFFDESNGNNRLRNFILENEDKVDKLELVFRTLYNMMLRPMSDEDKRIRQNIISQIRGIENETYRLYVKKDGTINVKITTAKDLIEGRTEIHIDENKNKERILNLEKETLPIEQLVKSLNLSDLTMFVRDRDLAGLLIYQAMYNKLMRTDGFVNDSNNMIDIDESIEQGKNFEMSEFMPEISHIMGKYTDYINLDQMVLCSLFRYINYLENNDISNKEYAEIKNRIEKLYGYLKHKNTKILLEVGKTSSGDYIFNEYRIREVKGSLEKLRPDKYMGKATVERIKTALLEGKSTLNSLQDGEIEFLNLSDEEKIKLVNLSDENYIYLIKTGNITKGLMEQINENTQEVKPEAVQALYENKTIDIPGIIDLYERGKINLDELLNLELPIFENITFEQVYENCQNNQHLEAYKKILDANLEMKEKYKSKAIEKYLENLDSSYLEVFISLGVIEKSDLEGVVDENDWIELLDEGTISEEFCITLYQKGFISTETVKNNKIAKKTLIKKWEEGQLATQDFEKLNIGVQELLQMCDIGELNGRKIHELLHTDEEKEKIRRQTRSAYAYGFYDTVKPGLACYNNNLMDTDSIVDLIKSMKIEEGEIVEACKNGFLSGEKIAQLRYRNVISPETFAKLKEEGLLTEQEEISVINNLTPQEIIEELEKNGIKVIVNMDEIMEKAEESVKRRKNNIVDSKKSRKNIIQPLLRHKVLKLLGTDIISSTPKQGFRGYQAYLIPALDIAVLEKLFSNDKEGNPKFNYGDATYVCELGKYIIVSGQSKQEIRAFMDVEGTNNGNIELVEHKKNWGKKLLKAICKVNPRVSTTRNASGKIDAITCNGKKLDINVLELSNLVEQMYNGDYTIKLEEH